MMPHIVSGGDDSIGWFSVARQRRSVCPSTNPTHFEKLLGVAPPPTQDHMVFGYTYMPSMDNDMGDLSEEDVWGDESLLCMPNRLTKQWLDSNGEVHFSVLLDTGEYDYGSRAHQFSSVTICNGREAMSAQRSHSSFYHMATSNQGIRSSNQSSEPFEGPRSAPVEVPLLSTLYEIAEPKRHYGEDDGGDDDRLPPHELLAKQHARRQISAFSVIEGAGRTLKGRDVSKVRDAVWKQTGFPG